MKGADLGLHFCKAAVVADKVISNSETLRAAGLRGQHALGLVPGFGIADEQSAQLRCFRTIDDENPVNKRLQGRFDQERYYDNLILTTGPIRLTAQFFGCVRLPDRLLPNARMDNALQALARALIGEHPLPQRSSIEMAGRIDNGIAKGLYDLIKRWLAGFHNLARNDISVDHCGTELGKQPGDGAFATGDAAGQAYA